MNIGKELSVYLVETRDQPDSVENPPTYGVSHSACERFQ